MAITVASRRVSVEKLRERFGAEAVILDITSRGPEPWVRFSPFYPHGGIPVPFSPGVESMTVEGIWQGLKVFERAGVDASTFAITTMHGLKRSAHAFGRVLGHCAGVDGDRLLPYLEARRAIYLPAYRWVLDHKLTRLINALGRDAAVRTLVLLDYETNADVDDTGRPLSHASLVQRYVEGTWPD